MSIKRTIFTTLGVVIGLFAAAAGALVIAYDRSLYVPAQGPPPEIVIRGGMLFDGTSTVPRANPGIVVRNGTIACVGPTCQVDGAAIEIDASGLSVLPGFIDLHAHFFGRREDPSVVRTIWDSARMMPGKRQALLESGVTSLRQLGDPRDAIREVRRMLEAREIAGPRLFVAGPIFTAPGGHPAYGGRDPNAIGIGGFMTFQSNDPAQVRAEVALLASQGVDGIKAVLHGSVSPDGQRVLPTLSPETFDALADEARAHGLWLAVHVGPDGQAEQAARAGATTVEHGVRHGNRIADSALQALVEHGVVYVPTLGVDADGAVNIPALLAAGVMLGVGTDEADYHGELQRLASAGVPPAEVLLAATRNGATALHRSELLGTVEQGKAADVVLVRGAPWEDIAASRNVVTVIQRGYVVIDRR